MNSLLKMLPLMIRLAGDHEDVREQAAFAAWRAASGNGVKNVCEPFRLFHKQLIIAVLDQTWKKQMERISGEYLFKINSLMGGPFVTFIEFRVDRKSVLHSRKAQGKPVVFHKTKMLEEELEFSATCIKDESLREKFLRAAAKCLERGQVITK
jgi:Dna[CI] antecedent, DciA